MSSYVVPQRVKFESSDPTKIAEGTMVTVEELRLLNALGIGKPARETKDESKTEAKPKKKPARKTTKKVD